MLLDAAMTHCLFARGVQGVTAKLDVKFRHPVRVGVQANVRARVVSWEECSARIQMWIK